MDEETPGLKQKECTSSTRAGQHWLLVHEGAILKLIIRRSCPEISDFSRPWRQEPESDNPTFVAGDLWLLIHEGTILGLVIQRSCLEISSSFWLQSLCKRSFWQKEAKYIIVFGIFNNIYFWHEHFKFHYLFYKHVLKLSLYHINKKYSNNLENIMNLLNKLCFLHPMNML